MASAASVWPRRAALAIALAWPLSLHCAILFAGPQWPPRVTAAAAAAGLVLWALAAGSARATAIALALVVLVAATLMSAPASLLLAPPIVLNAAVAAIFGSSLLGGREPLIATFARLERGDLPPDLAAHARRVTWCWTLLLGGNALAAAALAAWGSAEAWSLFANILSYAFMATLLLGEYAYRRVRFRGYRHASLSAQLRTVRRAGIFVRR